MDRAQRRLEAERHRRRLRIEGPAENVLRHWLTGETYVDMPITEQRRRKYPKGSARRKPAHKALAVSGHLSERS